jgi:hypothetical protein
MTMTGDRKPIHHHSRTVVFDGPDAADVLAQAARYCTQFNQPTELLGINIEYDQHVTDGTVCLLSITYPATRG